MDRYVDLTDDICQNFISLDSMDEKIIPVFMEVLYVPKLDIEALYVDKLDIGNLPVIQQIKKVLLYGFAHKVDRKIIIEYLNIDGFLEKRIYSELDCPNLYYRL